MPHSAAPDHGFHGPVPPGLRRRWPTAALLLLGRLLNAAEGESPPGRQAPQPPPIPPPGELLGWSHLFHPGFFFTSVYVSDDAAAAPDPTIQGSANSLSYRAVFDGALAWRSDTSALDQRLHLAYGQVKQADAGWLENIDEIRYDGVYRRGLAKPTFAYRSWGLETVFTSADHDAAFDPVRVFASWGVGQLYHDLMPGDALEWRLGVRVQKIWGSDLLPHQGDLLIGPEALLRYERIFDDLRSFFLMYEGWSEFSDPGHVTNTITGGLKMRFATHLTVELGLRMYYEARPDDVGHEVPGFSRWYVRQDSMIGVDLVF